MLPALLLAGLAVTSTLGVAVYARRRAERRRATTSMRARLEAHYAEVEPAESPVPLREPAGWVAVVEDGLALALGGEPGGLRHVPWSAVRQVVPAGGGAVSVHVARVGEVHVPGQLGRRLWERATAPPPG